MQGLGIRLLQDLCIRIQICIRILSDHLHQGPVGSLVQDLCIRILLDHLYRDRGFFSGSCRTIFFGPLVSGTCSTTCGRSLREDLCIRILLDDLYQDPVGPPAQDLCIRILVNSEGLNRNRGRGPNSSKGCQRSWKTKLHIFRFFPACPPSFPRGPFLSLYSVLFSSLFPSMPSFSVRVRVEQGE